jgi:hypothetical protein
VEEDAVSKTIELLSVFSASAVNDGGSFPFIRRSGLLVIRVRLDTTCGDFDGLWACFPAGKGSISACSCVEGLLERLTATL